MDQLAPAGVVLRWLEPIVAAELLPAEARYVSRATAARVAEFSAGRALAREALAAFGQPSCPIHVGASREPVWPPGFTGSITHTKTLCAVALAKSADWASVGIDIEDVAGLEARSLWAEICSPRELAWVANQTDGALAATLVFAAKEALFKAQFPLTRRMLEFSDVELRCGTGHPPFVGASSPIPEVQQVCERMRLFVRVETRRAGVLALVRLGR